MVKAAVGICAPHDLKAARDCATKRFNQRVYMRNFRHAQTKGSAQTRTISELPMTVSGEALRVIFSTDNDFTAPLHGFKDAEDYWQKSSSKQFMGGIAADL